MDDTQGADGRARAAALFSVLTKFVVAMRSEQVDQLLAGSAKLFLLPSGHQVVEPLAGLDTALKFVKALSEDERGQLTDKTAKLALLRKGDNVQTKLDLDSIAVRLGDLSTEDAIVDRLDGDKRLTAKALKELAAIMNIAVPPSVKAKPAIQLHIAQQFLGDRRRTFGS